MTHETTNHAPDEPGRRATTMGASPPEGRAPARPPGTGWLLLAGASCAGLAVAAGAFGTHGLRARLDPAALAWWKTAVDYQFVHAFGLLILGVLAVVMPEGIRPALHRAGGAMLAGIALFCGSLYALALGAPRALAMATPVGGVAFLAGWALLALATWRAPRCPIAGGGPD